MMKRFFLFNELFKQNIKDDRVIDWIRSAFRLKILSENKVSLLSPKECQFDDFDFSFDFGFDIDFNFYNDPILKSQRLKLGSQIYHSQDYSNPRNPRPRKSNYIISYNDGLIRFYQMAN